LIDVVILVGGKEFLLRTKVVAGPALLDVGVGNREQGDLGRADRIFRRCAGDIGVGGKDRARMGRDTVENVGVFA